MVLGESPTYVINGSFGGPEKTFSINFSKTNIMFCLSLHYNGDPSYLFVNEKEAFKFKVNNRNANFPTQLCLRILSNGFGATENREAILKRNVYDFSVDCNTIDKLY